MHMPNLFFFYETEGKPSQRQNEYHKCPICSCSASYGPQHLPYLCSNQLYFDTCLAMSSNFSNYAIFNSEHNWEDLCIHSLFCTSKSTMKHQQNETRIEHWTSPDLVLANGKCMFVDFCCKIQPVEVGAHGKRTE